MQQTARRCASEHWINEDIQTSAIPENIRGMYDGTKKVLGPVQTKSAHLNSCQWILIHWLETTVRNRWNIILTSNGNRTLCLRQPSMISNACQPRMNWILNQCWVSTTRPLRVWLREIYEIPPDFIKQCKTTLLLPLREVLYQCWQVGALPRHTKDAKIIALQRQGRKNRLHQLKRNLSSQHCWQNIRTNRSRSITETCSTASAPTDRQ